MEVYGGEVLYADLSVSSIRREPLSDYKAFLGGRGVNQYILLRDMPSGCSWFDPDNVLAIGAGLMCGTPAPGAARVNIDTKNVFTGGIGSSNAGGEFGPAMRLAGIANIVVTGAAESLVYLYVDDGKIEIRDASHLRDQAVSETNRTLKRELGQDFHIMCIGPAGEHRVPASCVVIDNARVAARCGIGAVFGAKSLKAIAVRGTGSIDVARPQQFVRIVDECIEKMMRSKFNKRRMKYGVYCYNEPWDIEQPYRNFSGLVPPEEKKQALMPDKFLPYLTGKHSCGNCPIRCWTVHTVRGRDGKEREVQSLQGNDIDNFGAKLDMDTPEEVLEGHALCNDLGLDVDATSNAIGWAIDCYDRGILDMKDTDGKRLAWGDGDVIFDLIGDIAYRTSNLGILLGGGCAKAASVLGRGTEEYCMHIKGNDLYESIWMEPSWAFGTVVSARGGTHTRGATLSVRASNIPAEVSIERFGVPAMGGLTDYVNKERMVVFMERLNAICDCLGMCMFTHSHTIEMLGLRDYADLLSAAIGSDVSTSELLLIGERITTQEKAYNTLHTTWTRNDDLPPKRFRETKLAGKYRIDLDKWNALLDRYYEHHGWDKETSWPKGETLLKLGLQDAYSRLMSVGKIPA